ncbi:hypothetical protein GUG51_01020, partial [Xanthomonas citri pv. citri]|nr:hypothetical protein [Xanthomonas citri pv. citri]
MSNVFNKEQDAQATGLSSNDQLRTAIDQHRISVMDRYDLSPREREVANAILNGETRASAAQKLF